MQSRWDTSKDQKSKIKDQKLAPRYARGFATAQPARAGFFMRTVEMIVVIATWQLNQIASGNVLRSSPQDDWEKVQGLLATLTEADRLKQEGGERHFDNSNR